MSRPAPQIPVTRERDANYVYLIATEDFEFVKIGRARDAHARLKRLQTGNHLDLMIIAEILCEDEAEQQFHSRFKSERVRGEWFKCTDEMVGLADDDLDFRRSIGLPDEYFLTKNEVAFILETAGKPWNDEAGLDLQRQFFGEVILP